MNRGRVRLVSAVFALFLSSPPSFGADVKLPTKGLHLPGQGGRAARDGLATDPIGTAFVTGRWRTPKAGDETAAPDGSKRKWVEISADASGRFDARGGHLLLDVESPDARVVRLDVAGHSSFAVNGVLRGGDPYGYGYVHYPIALKPGSNELLIQLGGRQPLKLALAPTRSPASIDLSDATFPDVVVGEEETLWAGVVVLNGTDASLSGLAMTAEAGGVSTETKLPPIPPLSFRKMPIAFKAPAGRAEGTLPLKLVLRGDRELDSAATTIRSRRPNQIHKRTFVSGIDGSVQYYAVNPPPTEAPPDRPALFLTLHGASVEALGQAEAYAPKRWGYLIAPTNRRPYGFDWEDWGRLDAMEVLDLAQARFKTDPRRTYLTGHSMGGHGTWIVGATFPDRFAAIAPSAGWISMSSYAGLRVPENLTPLQALMRRAAAPSDTLSLADNYKPLGVYVLHGDADDNVPVGQARRMKEVLEKGHEDFHYFEQPKAGHWWSTPENEGAGAACVDWPPMFDLFARRTIPRDEEVLNVDFTTANPAVSSRSRWLTIEAQTKASIPSRARFSYRPGRRTFVGTTENVSRLSLDLSAIEPGALTVEIDKQTLKDVPFPATPGRILHLARIDDRWAVIPPSSPALKGPRRSGPFKEAFRNRMIFVYGTKGTPEENAWALAKARLDAENFYYRGNGSVDVVLDTAFDPAVEPDRNVILYGHAESNAAWSPLLAGSPIQARRGKVEIGKRTLTGDDLAVLFLRPRPGSDVASVAAVSGTGLPGLRRTDRLPYFVSGVAYPDATVLKADPGSSPDRGLVAVGFFGEDWSVEKGEFRFAGP